MPPTTTFSLPIMLSMPFKLDAVSESFSTCLEKRVEACKLRHEGKKSKIQMPKHIKILLTHMRVDPTLVGPPSCEGEEACNGKRVFFFLNKT